MAVNRAGIMQQPDQGSSYWVFNDFYTIKTAGEDTSGVSNLIELVVQPNSGSPLHIHSREDEFFYVLEGEFQFQIGEQMIVTTAGSFLYCPKYLSHGFTNIGENPGKLLTWYTPSGFEKFFEQVGVPAVDRLAPPLFSKADIEEKILAFSPSYGVEVIPPLTKHLS